jgi:adenylate cyclase
MLDEIEKSETFSREPFKRRMLSSLITMYGNTDSPYLNYYGPPGTITTVPFYQVIQARDGAGETPSRPALRGKMVFVGLSELLEFEQKDGFYTVFSQEDGRDISGVEIAATAFANLWEDRSVRPLGPAAYIALLFLWGLAIGVLCRFLPAPQAALVVTVLGLSYLFFAKYQFMSAGRWCPLVSPLFIQTTVAFFGAVLWKYVDANRERQNIKKAFGYYLPEEVVDGLAKNISDLDAGRRLVHGVCLCTDVEHYSTLAETMEPEELGKLMNNYYETVFKPVRHHGGHISDVVGDSMMALWVSVNPDALLRDKACWAAVDIRRAIHQFNRVHEGRQLHTRIGVHSGPILLGNVGAMDHFEYRPVGDMVNTAARIEGLNKHLGTRILVSDEALTQLGGFLSREVGAFLLAGKTKPLIVHELVCPLMEADALTKRHCALFQEALHHFRGRQWDEAAEKYHVLVRESGADGPSRFYLNLCDRFRNNPPDESWDGVVRMEEK